jgi:hypothetical protein
MIPGLNMKQVDGNNPAQAWNQNAAETSSSPILPIL